MRSCRPRRGPTRRAGRARGARSPPTSKGTEPLVARAADAHRRRRARLGHGGARGRRARRASMSGRWACSRSCTRTPSSRSPGRPRRRAPAWSSARPPRRAWRTSPRRPATRRALVPALLAEQPELMASLVGRAEAAGYTAIVVTLDTRLMPWRPKDLTGAYLPFLLGEGLANYTSTHSTRAAAPATMPPRPSGSGRRSVPGTMLTLGRPAVPGGRSPSTWSPDDAPRRRPDRMDGVVVSAGTIDGSSRRSASCRASSTPVGPDVPVLLDSGVRTGSDVLKALALGAGAMPSRGPTSGGSAWPARPASPRSCAGCWPTSTSPPRCAARRPSPTSGRPSPSPRRSPPRAGLRAEAQHLLEGRPVRPAHRLGEDAGLEHDSLLGRIGSASRGRGPARRTRGGRVEGAPERCAAGSERAGAAVAR